MSKNINETLIITSNTHQTYLVNHSFSNQNQNQFGQEHTISLTQTEVSPTETVVLQEQVQDFVKPLTSTGFLKDQFLRTTVGRVVLNQEFQKQVNGTTGTDYVKYDNYLPTY